MYKNIPQIYNYIQSASHVPSIKIEIPFVFYTGWRRYQAPPPPPSTQPTEFACPCACILFVYIPKTHNHPYPIGNDENNNSVARVVDIINACLVACAGARELWCGRAYNSDILDCLNCPAQNVGTRAMEFKFRWRSVTNCFYHKFVGIHARTHFVKVKMIRFKNRRDSKYSFGWCPMVFS